MIKIGFHYRFVHKVPMGPENPSPRTLSLQSPTFVFTFSVHNQMFGNTKDKQNNKQA